MVFIWLRGIYLAQKFKLKEFFDARFDARKEQEEFQPLRRTFAWLSEAFHLTLRVQEQCFTQFNIVLRTTARDHPIHPYFLAFLIALKAANPELYKRFVNQEATSDEVMQYLGKSKAGKDFVKDPHGAAVEAYLISAFLNREKLEGLVGTYRGKAEQQKGTADQERAATIFRELHYISGKGPGVLNYLAKKIQMSERFNP